MKIVGIVVLVNLLFCICELRETGGRREAAAPVSFFRVLLGRVKGGVVASVEAGKSVVRTTEICG